MPVNADFKAIIFDMDGVLTDTRQLHVSAWKKTFDEYLLKSELKIKFSEQDYDRFVDGKIRADGVKSYLESIGVSPTSDQISEIGNIKNSYFLELLQTWSLSTFKEVMSILKKIRESGMKIGVVSSSENCKMILKKLQLDSLIDKVIDGSDGKELHLRGKPEIDYYQHILKLLGVDAQSCALVEDSISGVEAGKKAKLTVFGLSRLKQTDPLKLIEAGADYIIEDLTRLGEISDAISSWGEIFKRMNGKEPALFLDFDGTISEIVSRPEEAVLLPGMKELLLTCSQSLKLAIISGRDRTDVKARVNIGDIFYAGSHGLDISGPGCFHYSYEGAEPFVSSLEQFNLTIETILLGINGLIIEKKQFCTSVHFRMTNPGDETLIKKKVREAILSFPKLKIREGKKVLEILPNVNWGKDKAIIKLLEVLNIDLKKHLPIFIGDDSSDEEAFYGLKDFCLCIRVTELTTLKTHAHYYLSDSHEVAKFISLIRDTFTWKEKRWRYGN